MVIVIVIIVIIVIVCFTKYVIVCNSGIESWLHPIHSKPDKKQKTYLPLVTSFVGIDVSDFFRDCDHGDFIGISWGFFRGFTNRRRDVWTYRQQSGHLGVRKWPYVSIHPPSAMAGHREKVDEMGCQKVGEQQQWGEFFFFRWLNSWTLAYLSGTEGAKKVP